MWVTHTSIGLCSCVHTVGVDWVLPVNIHRVEVRPKRCPPLGYYTHGYIHPASFNSISLKKITTHSHWMKLFASGNPLQGILLHSIRSSIYARKKLLYLFWTKQLVGPKKWLTVIEIALEVIILSRLLWRHLKLLDELIKSQLPSSIFESVERSAIKCFRRK